jgi:hypothetical protein
MAEMEAVAAVCPPTGDATRRRLARGEQMRRGASAGGFDRSWALARVDALLGGVVA